MSYKNVPKEHLKHPDFSDSTDTAEISPLSQPSFDQSTLENVTPTSPMIKSEEVSIHESDQDPKSNFMSKSDVTPLPASASAFNISFEIGKHTSRFPTSSGLVSLGTNLPTSHTMSSLPPVLTMPDSGTGLSRLPSLSSLPSLSTLSLCASLASSDQAGFDDRIEDDFDDCAECEFGDGAGHSHGVYSSKKASVSYINGNIIFGQNVVDPSNEDLSDLEIVVDELNEAIKQIRDPTGSANHCNNIIKEDKSSGNDKNKGKGDDNDYDSVHDSADESEALDQSEITKRNTVSFDLHRSEKISESIVGKDVRRSLRLPRISIRPTTLPLPHLNPSNEKVSPNKNSVKEAEDVSKGSKKQGNHNGHLDSSNNGEKIKKSGLSKLKNTLKRPIIGKTTQQSQNMETSNLKQNGKSPTTPSKTLSVNTTKKPTKTIPSPGSSESSGSSNPKNFTKSPPAKTTTKNGDSTASSAASEPKTSGTSSRLNGTSE